MSIDQRVAIAVGREIERRLIADAELERDARRAYLRQWAAGRAATRERLAK